MRCGDRGNVTVAGVPCQQPINARALGCLHHDPSTSAAYKRAQYTKAGLTSRMRHYLPADTTPPEFSSTSAIVAWAQDTAHQVLGGLLDPRAAGEARQLAALTIQARAAEAQERLVDALLRLEHGGAAMVLLSRLQDGITSGTRRLLPGRVVSMPEPPEPA